MADQLEGNADPALKDRVWTLWRYLGGNAGDDPDFGYENKKTLTFVALNAYGDKDDSGREKRTIETIHEAKVTQAYLNSAGTMHGGCTAWLIDVSATLTPFADGPVFTVSMNLNVTYHAPAPLGTTLRIISRSVSAGGRVQTVRSEIWDIERNRLVASGVHLKMLPRSKL